MFYCLYVFAIIFCRVFATTASYAKLCILPNHHALLMKQRQSGNTFLKLLLPFVLTHLHIYLLL